MPTPCEELQQLVDDINSMQLAELVHSELESASTDFDYTFGSVERELSAMLRVYQLFSDTPLDQLPRPVVNDLHAQTSKNASLLREFRAFGMDAQSPKNKHKSLIKGLSEQYNATYHLFAPLLSFALWHTGEMQTAVSEVRQKREEAEKDIEVERDRFKQIVADADAAKAAIQDAAKIDAVGAHAKIFSDAAIKHRDMANRWLAGTGAVLLLALVVLVIMVQTGGRKKGSPAPTTPEVLQQSAGRALVLSVLLYGVVFCGRQYRAHMHNRTLNEHRHNALASFREFLNSTSDPETKNAVLLRATQTIYAAQMTGYVGKESGEDSSIRLIETVRNIQASK